MNRSTLTKSAALAGTILLLNATLVSAQTVMNPSSTEMPTPTPMQTPLPSQTNFNNIPGGGDASQSANNAGGSQSGAETAAMLMAGLLMAQCLASTPPGASPACPMSALAAMQAAALAGESQGSQGVAQDMASAAGTGLAVMPSATPAIGSVTGAGSELSSPNSILATAKSLGITPNADGSVTLADGSTIPPGGTTDAGALAAAGYGADQIQTALSDLAADQAKAKSQVHTVDMDASGGGGGAKHGLASSPFNPFAGLKVPGGAKKASVAGMSKNLGNDKIGVAGDDIFEMVTRRYKARDAANNFFKK